jgi:hypothetical protein
MDSRRYVSSKELRTYETLFAYKPTKEAILGATDPNRIVWMSGTVNNPGAPSNPDGKGSVILDNNATPGQSP